MDITLDLSSIGSNASYWGPLTAAWQLFLSGGWVVFLIVFLCGFYYIWLTQKRITFQADLRYIMLAIDVPKDNIQTPKAVEQIFAHLHGIQKKGNLKERYLHGYVQPAFSLELISIEGYIQFIIRTPQEFRDMVEAAIYAQYPEAEITEVDDYSKDFEPVFPNDKFDIWGTEFKLAKKQVYPIKTYPSFEHPIAKTIIDPMASLLEILSRFKKGEQLWIQLIIAPPANENWREAGLRSIHKLIGTRTEKSPSIFWLPKNIIQGVSESITATVIPPSSFEEEVSSFRPGSLMMSLPPNEKAVVEAVGMKISKLGFITKFRIIYLAQKGSFEGSRPPSIEGAIKQFSTLDLNGFKFDKKTRTKIDYFFIKTRLRFRKRHILKNFKLRSYLRGYSRFILNTEELASVYHFPSSETVKAPLVKKTEAKRGEPPFSLPVKIEEELVTSKRRPREVTGVTETPENLPLS